MASNQKGIGRKELAANRQPDVGRSAGNGQSFSAILQPGLNNVRVIGGAMFNAIQALVPQ